MFNFFKRKIKGDRQNCYLIQSGAFEQRILDNDKLILYNDLLRDDEIPEDFKVVIQSFLIPYKISVLKYTLNEEYFEEPFSADFQKTVLHIAPSLRKIRENPFDIPMGYPRWFFIAFPDVVLWAMKGEGFESIKRRYRNLSEEEIVDDNYIRSSLLHDIINLYQNTTNKPLECRLY